MFGSRKKRLLEKMQGLHQVAGTCVFLRCESELLSSYGREEASAQSAAILASLFGRLHNPELDNLVDMDQMRDTAAKKLAEDPELQELVVQTLRVEGTLAAEGRHPPLTAAAESLLETHGARFPHAPTPQSYDALVESAVRDLPDDARTKLMGTFGVG